MNAKFSIIMPCYNSENYIDRAIESVLSQTYWNWELIAINDGSFDNTKKILENYANTDSRIRVYSKINGGYSSAINFGMQFISGEYFLFLGSDDALTVNLLEKLSQHIECFSPDIIGFKAIKIYPSKKLLDPVTNFETLVHLDKTTLKDFEELYPLHTKILCIRDTAKCFKSSVRGTLSYYGKYGYDADGIFSTLFCHNCSSFLVTPIEGYLWTIRNDSLSSKTTKSINFDRISNWVKYIKEISKFDISQYSKRDIRYIDYPMRISDELFKHEEKLTLSEIILLARARKIVIQKKKALGHPIIFNTNNLKNRLIHSLHLPYCFYYRYRCKRLPNM